MCDETGAICAQLSANDGFNSLELFDGEGQTRVLLEVNEFGPTLDLLDEKGKTRAKLDLQDMGPSLGLLDGKSARVRLTLSDESDVPSLSLSDKNHNVRAWLMAGQRGPNMMLLDEHGQPFWSTPREEPRPASTVGPDIACWVGHSRPRASEVGSGGG